MGEKLKYQNYPVTKYYWVFVVWHFLLFPITVHYASAKIGQLPNSTLTFSWRQWAFLSSKEQILVFFLKKKKKEKK